MDEPENQQAHDLQIYSTEWAFAGLKEDGSIDAWWNVGQGWTWEPTGRFVSINGWVKIDPVLLTGWNLRTTSYVQNFDVSTQEGNPYAIELNSDGTKMFVWWSNREVYEYSLSTAYDISTASYTQSFDVSTEMSNDVASLRFNDDGTKIFVLDSWSNDLYEYSLSTAYDISTMSYTSNFIHNTGERGLAFSADGTQVFGSLAGKIEEFTLGTAWDLSTEGVNNTYSSYGSDGWLAFNSDGTSIYLTDTTNIIEYSLWAPYDLSTLTLVYTFDASEHADDIVFHPNGTKMYIINRANSEVREYDL